MQNKNGKNVLVLGAGGMLGNAIFRLFADDRRYATATFGTLRSASKARYFTADQRGKLIEDVDVMSDTGLGAVFADTEPSIVINCVGIIKQQEAARDPLTALAINAMLPHRLARHCEEAGARLIHMSTDCVFSGRTGMYTEDDFPDANDLYGRTKYLGEMSYANTVTLRTSIIGHELGSRFSLIEWFLAQTESVRGYSKAIFSGLPTIEIARVIRDFVIENPDLSGTYHLSSDAISKNDLLTMVAKIYGKQISVIPDEAVDIDRSLDSCRFRAATGYAPAAWSDLVKEMRHDHLRHVRSIARE